MAVGILSQQNNIKTSIRYDVGREKPSIRSDVGWQKAQYQVKSSIAGGAIPVYSSIVVVILRAIVNSSRPVFIAAHYPGAGSGIIYLCHLTDKSDRHVRCILDSIGMPTVKCPNKILDIGQVGLEGNGPMQPASGVGTNGELSYCAGGAESSTESNGPR